MLAHCPPRRIRVRQRVGALLSESPRQPLLVALLRHAVELARARPSQVSGIWPRSLKLRCDSAEALSSPSDSVIFACRLALVL